MQSDDETNINSDNEEKPVAQLKAENVASSNNFNRPKLNH